MDYHQLGKTALQISRIGFGCMSLKAGQSTAASLIDAAIDGGINYFDTADLYEQGANEAMIGTLLAARRTKIILATKVGNQWRQDGSGWDWNPRKAYILNAAEQSLKRLKTDYIDLYQLHGGTIQDPIEETIEAFELLLTAGKIRSYGISSIRPNVIRAYVEKSRISSVMQQYSLADRRPEETCFSLLEKNSISVLARGTLAGGLLINKAATAYLSLAPEAIQQMQEQIKKIALQYEVAPATVALNFALQPAAVSAAVIGIRTMEQLDEALRALKQTVPREALQALADTSPVNFYTDHR